MPARLTYSNVVSTLCLFLLLGGGAAYAASHLGKNSVGSRQLQKNSVTTAKIKKEAVTAAKVKTGALTGRQIKASTLGTVPNAGHAGSADVAGSLPGPEPWHGVGGPGEPLFLNGCHNAGIADTASVRFYRDQIGIVHLEGLYNGCSAEGATAFQLPAGFRPGPTLNFSLPQFGNEGAVIVHGSAPTLAADKVGGVSCPVTLCILDGISFRAES